MPGWRRCRFYNCKCGNLAEYDPDDKITEHYRRTKTRKELMDKAKELGISDNPHFESTWILALKIGELSGVNVV